MVFSQSDYWFAGIFIPLAIFFGIIGTTLIISRYLTSKKYRWTTILFLWVIVLVLLLHGLFKYSHGFTYPISAALQTDADQYITVGNVEQLRPAPSPPFYFNPISKQLCSATLVTVDGVQFYIPYCDIKPDQTVQLRWSTEEHVVYSYHILRDEEMHQSGTDPIAPPSVSQQNISNGQLGLTLIIVSATLFVLMYLLQFPLGKAIAPHFSRKDQNCSDIVRPNRFGLTYVCVPLFLMCGILVGLALRGFDGAIIVIFVGALFIGRMVLKKQTTTAFLEGNFLVIKDIETTYRIEKNSIQTVRFAASRLPYNRCLILTLKNGRIFRFEQENFYGLDCIYKKLSNSTGDGTVSR